MAAPRIDPSILNRIKLRQHRDWGLRSVREESQVMEEAKCHLERCAARPSSLTVDDFAVGIEAILVGDVHLYPAARRR